MTALRRVKQPMSDDVAAALVEVGQRRIEQMLQELEAGGVCMRMDHPPSARQ